MDVIGKSLANGIDGSEDECEDHKPVIDDRGMVGENSSSRVNPSSALSLRLPIETNINTAGGVSYRVLPFKVDPSMEPLPEGESPVPITPIIATQLTAESNEPRLALIASTEPQNETSQTVVVTGGQVYLISDSVNATSGNRRILPHTTDSVLTQRMSTSREEKRRVTHNEVERRRRDKINNWICRLAKILPECSDVQTKTSQVVGYSLTSKGVILAKACDHIEELKKQVRHLSEKLCLAETRQSSDQLKQEIEILKRENNGLKNDNALLKAQLHQHGILDELTS